MRVMELLIDSQGREEEAFKLLKANGFGVIPSPDDINCCDLPATTNKAIVESVLRNAGIKFAWIVDDEMVFPDPGDDTPLMADDD